MSDLISAISTEAIQFDFERMMSPNPSINIDKPLVVKRKAPGKMVSSKNINTMDVKIYKRSDKAFQSKNFDLQICLDLLTVYITLAKKTLTLIHYNEFLFLRRISDSMAAHKDYQTALLEDPCFMDHHLTKFNFYSAQESIIYILNSLIIRRILSIHYPIIIFTIYDKKKIFESVLEKIQIGNFNEYQSEFIACHKDFVAYFNKLSPAEKDKYSKMKPPNNIKMFPFEKYLNILSIREKVGLLLLAEKDLSERMKYKEKSFVFDFCYEIGCHPNLQFLFKGTFI